MGMPDTPQIEVVREFLAALERQDVDAVLARTDPDIVYQNVPLPPARGLAAFEKQMRGFARYLDGFEVRFGTIAAADDGVTVLTERVDVLVIRKLRAEFWVCGTFEVRDGKVTLWRDYFDYAALTASFVTGAGRALVAAIRSRNEG
jgi:limonene-1,2-epoxide hydrolase